MAGSHEREDVTDTWKWRGEHRGPSRHPRAFATFLFLLMLLFWFFVCLEARSHTDRPGWPSVAKADSELLLLYAHLPRAGITDVMYIQVMQG